MTTSETHLDVASYALGVLDLDGTDRFEEHLALCDACATELEELLPVTRLMAEIDRHAFLKAEESLQNGKLLERMQIVVSLERRRNRIRGVLAVAAAVVIGIVTTLVLATGPPGRDASNPNVAGGRSSATSPTSSGLGIQSSLGIGGPENLPAGTRYSATDLGTGVVLELFVDGKPWGSQLAISLSRVKGPFTCTLVAVSRNGAVETVSHWTVSAEGYGTPAHAEPLLLMAATGFKADTIDRIEVHAVKPPSTSDSTLVTVHI
jgi:hypothetical protein